MSNDLKEVEPGDLIESRLFNQLVRRIRELEERVPDPGPRVTVPRFVGQRLGNSVDTINQPNVFLNLGSVFDGAGSAVTPSLSENRERIVVSQMPRPGVEVSRNQRVDLLVAAEKTSDDGDDGSTVPVPTITSITPDPQHIGSPVTIAGSNFSTDASEVSVTIDDVPVDEIRGLDANSMEVTVPENVRDPAADGQTTRTVTVSVTSRGRTATFETFAVESPSETDVPEITAVDTKRHHDDSREQGQATEGEKIAVVGRNFADTAEMMTVTFVRSGLTDRTVTPDAVRSDVDGRGTDELDVTIPDFGLDSRSEMDLRVSITDGPTSPVFDGSANPGGSFQVFPAQ